MLFSAFVAGASITTTQAATELDHNADPASPEVAGDQLGFAEEAATPDAATLPVEPDMRPLLDPAWLGPGVAYGYHRLGQSPGGVQPSREELLEDLGIIARHWNLVRVYNADDTSARVLALIRERQLPLKVMLGTWLAGETADPAVEHSNLLNVRRAIELAGQYPDVVLAICAGNETQVEWSGHRLETSRLVHYLREVRRHSTVPVTTADDFSYWRRHESRSVAQEVDFITVHAHPLWNGLTVGHAFEWLDGVWTDVQACHPDIPLVLGETGWATCHDATKVGPGAQGTLMKGEVSEAAQEGFLPGLTEWVQHRKVPTFLFEAFDEPWKGGGEASGPLEVEKHWGVYHENRTPKTAVLALPGGGNATRDGRQPAAGREPAGAGGPETR